MPFGFPPERAFSFAGIPNCCVARTMTLRRREFLGFLGTTFAASAQQSLADEWRQIASASDGIVGAAAMHLKSGQHAALNGQDSFPLASVCKMPIAMRLLAMVDEGKLSLDQNIEVLPRDVWPSWNGDVGSGTRMEFVSIDLRVSAALQRTALQIRLPLHSGLLDLSSN
jgi:hypothetical protein